MDSSPRTKPGRRPARERVRQLFTLEHANRTLPLVRRIVTDIVGQYREVASLQAACNNPSADSGPEARRELEERCGAAVEKLRQLAEELSDVGCELKDWQTGLIDFRAMHEGREVYLCWRLGEETIEYWHELDAGFTGRVPIDPSFQTA